MAEERRLSYSERKKLAETGSLGPLELDAVPEKLRRALVLYLGSRLEAAPSVAADFRASLKDWCGRHYGSQEYGTILATGSVDDFLDLVEKLAGLGPTRFTFYNVVGHVQSGVVAPRAADDINEMFDHHRFGYRLSNGEIEPLGSPALTVTVVGPALLASQRAGWEEAERNYREAVQHSWKEGEGRAALTAANAAVESALKAAGFKGATLGDLVKEYRKSPAVASYSAKTVDALGELIGQLMAWRSTKGNAHGQAPGSDEPPRALVTLAVHWAGSFIVYLDQLA